MDLPDKGIVRGAPVSLYYQLKEEFLRRITSKQWLPGQKIPAEMELCRLYDVSRITVRKAIDELVRSGHLVRQQGRGTFVTNLSVEQHLSKFYSFSEELKSRGIVEHVRVLQFETVAASGSVAAALAVEPAAQVFHLTRLRMVDETPYTLETSHIPVAVCPGLTQAALTEKGLYNAMRACGVHPDRVIEKFRATALRNDEAARMGLSVGTPAMHLERVTYFAHTPVEYCNSIVRGDFFTYTVELK